MRQIQLGDSRENIQFRRTELDDIIELEVTQFKKKIKLSFSSGDLEIALRFLTEETANGKDREEQDGQTQRNS
jgi:hypothetical protein